jgi:hypothetical protein
MIVNGGVNPYDSHRFGFGYIDTIQRQRFAADSQNRILTSKERDASIQAFKQVMRVREAVQAIRPMMLDPETIQVGSSASATSASELNIGTTTPGTPTTLQSTEEVNASVLNSYSTDPPEWTDSSTAQATVGGEYDGSNGTDTLTFSVKKGGTLGGDLIQIEIRDSSNKLIDSLNFKKQDSVNTPYTLSNGLTVTFSEGTFVKNDTFTLEVSSEPQAVNPDNPFNGTGSADPNFEDGLAVTEGSFQINGTTIAVAADDTINNVLDKINSSDAGVTATFDPETETVLLTQNTPGSTQDIVLSNDTSGFAAAVKLDGAVATPGEDGTEMVNLDAPLAEVEGLSVESGSITVNGVSINIDVNMDSLNDVLDRITASEAGVTASFDSNTNRVSVVSNDPGSQLTIASGSTNFFPAIDISEGTYEGTTTSVEEGGVDAADVSNLVVESIVEENSEKPWEQNSDTKPPASLDTKKLSTLVSNMADAMNTLFDDSTFEGAPGGFVEEVRDNIRTAVASWFDSKEPDSKESQYETEFGLRFDFDKGKTDEKHKVFNFSQDQRSRFEAALADPQGSASVRNALFGQKSNGLFNQLHATLTAAAASFEKEVDPTGLFLNVSI